MHAFTRSFLSGLVEYQSQQSSTVMNSNVSSFQVVNTANLLEFGHCVVSGGLLN